MDNINYFMRIFHEFERDHDLFHDRVDGELWWDTVRYDVGRFIFDGIAPQEFRRSRKLGILRRWMLRKHLFIKAQIRKPDLLVFRTARTSINGHMHDLVLDPIVDLFTSPVLSIDTFARLYHLPDFNPSRWTGKVPGTLPDLIQTILGIFEIKADRAAALDTIIQRVRSEHECRVAGYHRLFNRIQPKAVLLVQNGIQKSLFHVANERGIPTIEAQHGLIGYGHMAYSYPRDVDYSRQTGMPSLFLTFSEFFQNNCHYPAGRKEVIGTDCFASGFAPMDRALGTIMVLSADIYHRKLLDLTRQIAARMPDRQFLYKLHPNQKEDEAFIRSSLADIPNITVGNPLTPASRLMENVSHLLAVQSTVVYEALQNGRRISIVPYHAYDIHSDIFGLPSVLVHESVDDIISSLEIPNTGAERPVFFEKFNPERAHKLIAPLLDSSSHGTESR
jgi:hypothetical protein